MTEFKEEIYQSVYDYGFKKLFGEEPNKDLLLDFLNELLRKVQGKITELQYLKNENLATTELNKKAVFDLYCTNEKGEKFIVKIQKTKQPNKNLLKTVRFIIQPFPAESRQL